jgi:hypothetical protein
LILGKRYKVPSGITIILAAYSAEASEGHSKYTHKSTTEAEQDSAKDEYVSISESVEATYETTTS